jgi:hypothetical protein
MQRLQTGAWWLRMRVMKVVMVGFVGLLLGAVVGGIVGVGLGLIWVDLFHTSSFEGYSGMLVFYSFMPLGIILGALTGAVGLGFLAFRKGPA